VERHRQQGTYITFRTRVCMCHMRSAIRATSGPKPDVASGTEASVGATLSAATAPTDHLVIDGVTVTFTTTATTTLICLTNHHPLRAN
jgi:hypothetical protein